MLKPFAAAAFLVLSATSAFADMHADQFGSPVTTRIKDEYGDIQMGLMEATVDGLVMNGVNVHIIRVVVRQGSVWSLPYTMVTDCADPARYFFDRGNINDAEHAHPGTIIDAAIKQTCTHNEVKFVHN